MKKSALDLYLCRPIMTLYGHCRTKCGYGTPVAGTTGTTGTPSATPTPKKSSGYNNGSLSTDIIKRMQEYINSGIDNPSEKIAVDGKWGPATQAASGGFTAEEFLPAYYRFNSWSGRTDR